MTTNTATNPAYGTVERPCSTCCRSISLLAFALLSGSYSLANAQGWNGNGPFPPGAGSRNVHALAINPATGTVYAGTGSGTVFALSDASLSQPPEVLDDIAVTNPGIAISIDVIANDVDPEDALDAGSVVLQSTPVGGTATENGDGTVTFTPDVAFVGPDSFSYTVRDLAGNESDTANVSVRVNAQPTAANDTASVVQNEPVTVDVLANDTDADGSLDPATVAIWDSPSNGGAIVEADGRITFTSGPDFTGETSFTYKVGDNDGGVSSEATVFVTVTASEPANVPPVALDDVAAAQESVPVTVVVLANDSDADGTLDPATVSMQTAPDNGSTEVNADGTITYTPDAAFTGIDSFTYTVQDDGGASSNAAAVSVTVTAPGADNSPPAAQDDAATTEEATAVVIDVLANDSDADGTLDPATVSVQTAPDGGSAEANADGTVTYTPNAGFSGTDTFTYTVADDAGEASGAATVTVTVNAAVNPPAPPPPSGSGGGGGGASGLWLLAVLAFALLRRRDYQSAERTQLLAAA